MTAATVADIAQQAIQAATQAISQGDRRKARRWAHIAASLRPDQEEPWLILAALGSPSASIAHLNRALRINPTSERAIRGMEWAKDRLKFDHVQLKSAYVPLQPAGYKSGIILPVTLSETYPILEEKEKESDSEHGISRLLSKPSIRVARYLSGKFLSIALTIFIGVFITVLLTSQPSRRGMGPSVSPFETSLEKQIGLVVVKNIRNGTIPLGNWGTPIEEQVDAYEEQLRTRAGLNLPYLPRHLLWTVKAVTFQWGQLGERIPGWGNQPATAGANDIILEYLPHTLLLIGAAYLLVYLIGMPLSLFLAGNYGKLVDRIFAFFSPISSVPSWVFGILLITLFAFQLRWLPFVGMFDSPMPTNPLEYILNLARHMLLPVVSIVLSLLFQIVYAWRTFFIIYSEEDYVDLAKAKGLPAKLLNQQYIMRPALPYVITSFATSLIGFWQLSMALEVVFRWPGLGWLYIKEALPNFWGESMEPGELIIAIGIVVVFAYLLGLVMFLLDIIYVIVDPRIRLMSENIGQLNNLRVKHGNGSFWQRWKERKKAGPPGTTIIVSPVLKKAEYKSREKGSIKRSFASFIQKAGFFLGQIRRYPSAIFGLVVVLLLLLGSLYALIALPYIQIGKEYEQKRLAERAYKPHSAMPIWFNLFSDPDYLSSLILDENDPLVSVSSTQLDNGWIDKTITFTFDYQYKEMPSEVFLYFDPVYKEKLPYVTLEWETPDGKIRELKRTIAEPASSYDFESSLQVFPTLASNQAWKKWFVSTELYTTPVFKLLFAVPGSENDTPQRGNYRLTIHSLLFEEGSDLKVQFVALGQVYGWAGTDYARRDMIVPLFWGMPFALLIGLLGSIFTTLIAMILPAIGVWFGGWVDNLIQRFTEINMVLPGLAIAVLVNVLFNLNIWIVLGIVVVINAFGSPIKIIRSALLQAKEAPYIEGARAYGTSHTRIILHYLLPRILPVLIPQLLTQIPSFIFLEATLGFFNIQSVYPSWGRIIYDGLAHGALYGSPFWVLEPIFLLLLTGFAFSMLGSALERILNPRMINISEVPTVKIVEQAVD